MKRNRRKSKRYRISHYFKNTKIGRQPFFFAISNRVTNAPVGHVVDLSETGIKIISNNPCEEGALLKLKIELPQPIEGEKQLTVNGRCIWCKVNTDIGHFSIGIEFLSNMPNHDEIIGRVCKKNRIP